MSLLTVEARNMSLDSKYGANHSTVFPSTLKFHLYTGDPTGSGVELSGGSYAAVTVNNDGTFWPAAANGTKKNAATVAFPTSTAAWSGTAAWLVLKTPAGVIIDGAPLNDPINVGASGRVVQFLAGEIMIIEPSEV